MPNPGQTIFPYIIVTSSSDYVPVAEQYAHKQIEVGCGVISFLSKSDFKTIFASLYEVGSGFALILAEDLNYFGDGNFSRVFHNVR